MASMICTYVSEISDRLSNFKANLCGKQTKKMHEKWGLW